MQLVNYSFVGVYQSSNFNHTHEYWKNKQNQHDHKLNQHSPTLFSQHRC